MREPAPAGRALPARAAPAAATGLALAAASCSFVLDFSGSTEQPIDAGPPDASPLEACDTLEPNNSLADAVSVTAGTYDLGLCDGDTGDFLDFELQGGGDLEATVTFEYEAERRDLVLRLYDDAGTEIDAATSGGAGQTTLERTAALSNQLAAGSYTLEVVMNESITEPAPDSLYQLSLTY